MFPLKNLASSYSLSPVILLGGWVVDGLAIDSDAADEQWRQDVVAVIIVAYQHTAALGKYVDVIHGGNTNRAAIGQMDSKWHERLEGNQPTDVSNHDGHYIPEAED